MSQKVYISGALTNIDRAEELKHLYEVLGKLCTKLGYEPYIPHLITDPIENPDITPQEVFQIDKEQLLGSVLVIAYIGTPSLGVGMEIAYAETEDIPIIVLYEKQAKVSRLPRGAPNIAADIPYSTELEALTQVQATIIELDKSVVRSKLPKDELQKLLQA